MYPEIFFLDLYKSLFLLSRQNKFVIGHNTIEKFFEAKKHGFENQLYHLLAM
jgi:hypothetical protein